MSPRQQRKLRTALKLRTRCSTATEGILREAEATSIPLVDEAVDGSEHGVEVMADEVANQKTSGERLSIPTGGKRSR